jgi:hypothetical protein
MKKINMFKFIIYTALVLSTGSTRAQAAPDTLIKTVEFPFVRQQVPLQAQVSVLPPALVGEQRFKNNLADDCRKFEETYNQYAIQVDDLSRDLASSIRELALGYTMKPGYELLLAVELASSKKPIEPSKWSLASNPTTRHFEEGSMMSISEKIGLKPKNVELDSESQNVLVLRSRDLACDLLSGRIQLMSTINFEVRADERAASQARQVVQTWLDQVRSLEKMDMNDRQKAAWLGFEFESFKKDVKTDSLAEYLNIHYFFETFFQPNQIILQLKWQSDLSQNWHKTIQVTLPVGVKRL